MVAVSVVKILVGLQLLLHSSRANHDNDFKLLCSEEFCDVSEHSALEYRPQFFNDFL